MVRVLAFALHVPPDDLHGVVGGGAVERLGHRGAPVEVELHGAHDLGLPPGPVFERGGGEVRGGQDQPAVVPDVHDDVGERDLLDPARTDLGQHEKELRAIGPAETLTDRVEDDAELLVWIPTRTASARAPRWTPEFGAVARRRA